jgi:hypothetical protein
MKKLLKHFYKRLPIVKELLEINANLATARVAGINSFFRNELSSARYKDPRKLNHFEHQVFSQNGEDGIVAEIFRRIGTQSRFFVEFGAGDGLENGTTFLLDQGWRGCWIEANRTSAEQILARLRRPLSEGRLKFRRAFVTAENVVSLFSELEVPVQFDLLSLDIDRNTYHVWKALSRFQPRVVAVEYNSTFPADVEWIAEYAPERGWNNTMYFGASLKAYERLGAAFGYALVGCDFSGTNAFFVRNTEKLELFAEPFTAENHYEPPRYWSTRREAHARCFDDRVS